MGAFKVAVDLEDFDVETLLSKGNKLPLQREDKTFTIVASRSHMSAETREYVQQMRDLHGEVQLISKGSSLKLCMVAEGLPIATPVLRQLWSGIPQQGRPFVSMLVLRL